MRGNRIPALVVGLCSHGLAVARSLHNNAVDVFALESNLDLPATRSKCLTLLEAESLEPETIIEQLISARKQIESDENPVLFLTNDKMVQQVAAQIDRVQAAYRISWIEHASKISELADKSSLAGVADALGVRYPKSRVISSAERIASELAALTAPLIAKPAKPQGAFKALEFASTSEAASELSKHKEAFPIVVQEKVPGETSNLVFVSLVLDHGKVVESFVGRKLLSYPEPYGQGVAFQPIHNDDLVLLGERISRELGLSGQLSLEFKVHEGSFVFIEPNVGRTEYCVRLAIANGSDLPYAEYCVAVGKGYQSPQKGKRVNWFDLEREPTAPFRFWKAYKSGPFPFVDAYSSLNDTKPMFVWLYRTLTRKIRKHIYPG